MATAASAAERELADRAEAELVRGLREAEQPAYGELCARFIAPLHGFASARLAGSDDLAEEVAVQTVVDVVRNIRRFNPQRSSLAAWIYGIARRHIQRQRRLQLRKKSVPAWANVSLHSVPDVPDGADMAAGLASRLDARRQVGMLSELLSDVEMEVLILQCVDGLSAREIGQVVGRSHRAVESIIHRAKQKARERLGKDAA